jgi:hypothetical protein
VARTPTIYQSKTPLYAEEYDFDGEKVTSLTINVKQLNPKGDKIIGQAKINIDSLEVCDFSSLINSCLLQY